MNTEEVMGTRFNIFKQEVKSILEHNADDT